MTQQLNTTLESKVFNNKGQKYSTYYIATYLKYMDNIISIPMKSYLKGFCWCI